MQITQEHENKRLVNKRHETITWLMSNNFSTIFKVIISYYMFFAYFTLQHNKVDCLYLGLALDF